ncbi:type III secretion protein [Saccharibacter sp. EH611]|nr:flagellar biosynthetic protein FliR [Saccharibacter sp. EH60]MXV36029.1 type III secretion protein [Saccharibacter sp. EH611]MXV56888.1 type III secretion protein [Saccharibacter sp. EH70]MXV66752.1 type III secretion protein [Saccharibacter sp. EH60]
MKVNGLAGFFGSPNIGAPNGSIAILAGTFVIILCRVSAVIITAPALGETTIPTRIRAGIALAVTIALLPVIQDRLTAVSGEALRMPAMALLIVGEELLCGFFIGTLARLIALSLTISAQIISVFTGMTSIIQPDPQLGASSTAISHMANSLIPVILMTTGLYALPLHAISGSYSLFPAGHITSLLMGDMTVSIARTASETMQISMQLAAPFILIGALWPAMLGVLNRLMPSIQVYSTVIPAQIIGGILLLAMLIQVISGTWTERIQGILSNLPGIGFPPHP